MDLILVINSGSSSLKFGLFRLQHGDETPIVSGKAESIGKETGHLQIKDSVTGNTLHQEDGVFATQIEVLNAIHKHLERLHFPAPVAIGHRMVNGGPNLVTHQLITAQVLDEMTRCADFAPLHTPAAVRLIRHLQTVYPQIPQFACFDTEFHQTLPECAYRLPIPEKYSAQGIRRYGFHGLSYASIVHQLKEGLPPRTVVAHLGSGSSLAAIERGRSIDTSMGLTPTGGILTGTRTGDLDPGVLLFLMREGSANAEKLDAPALEVLVNQQSGLLAIGGSKDMRELEAAAAKADRKAQLAIDMYCRAIAKTVAAYASVLGGLDLLVFAGGIGENSQTVRSNVCSRLGFLGVELDTERNKISAPVISPERSPCIVRVTPSEEEQQIARYVRQLRAT
jgi:acetate kinase